MLEAVGSDLLWRCAREVWQFLTRCSFSGVFADGPSNATSNASAFLGVGVGGARVALAAGAGPDAGPAWVGGWAGAAGLGVVLGAALAETFPGFCFCLAAGASATALSRLARLGIGEGRMGTCGGRNNTGVRREDTRGFRRSTAHLRL
jgi:hypothetical protein